MLSKGHVKPYKKSKHISCLCGFDLSLLIFQESLLKLKKSVTLIKIFSLVSLIMFPVIKPDLF